MTALLIERGTDLRGRGGEDKTCFAKFKVSEQTRVKQIRILRV